MTSACPPAAKVIFSSNPVTQHRSSRLSLSSAISAVRRRVNFFAWAILKLASQHACGLAFHPIVDVRIHFQRLGVLRDNGQCRLGDAVGKFRVHPNCT